MTENGITEQTEVNTEQTQEPKQQKGKSKKDILALVITAVTFVAVAFMLISGISRVSDSSSQKSLCDKLVKTLIPIENTTGFDLYTSNETDMSITLEVMEPYMEKFPEEFVEEMTKDGWKVCLLSNLSNEQKEMMDEMVAISQKRSVSKIKAYRGLTVPSSKTIFILMRDVVQNNFDANTASKVFLHEMGHYLQLEKLSKSEINQWEEIYTPLRNLEEWVSVEPEESFSIMFEEAMERGEVLAYPDNERVQFQFILEIIEKHLGQ